MLYNRSLLIIHLKYSSVYMTFPKSLTIPSPWLAYCKQCCNEHWMYVSFTGVILTLFHLTFPSVTKVKAWITLIHSSPSQDNPSPGSSGVALLVYLPTWLCILRAQNNFVFGSPAYWEAGLYRQTHLDSIPTSTTSWIIVGSSSTSFSRK